MIRKDYFKRLWNETEWLSNLSGKSRFYFFVDGFLASVLHGSDISAYAKDGLWKFSAAYRINEVSQKRNGKAIHHFNDRNFIHLLLNKVDFNKHFATLVRRDWLYTNESTFEDFNEFLNKHELVFIKPIGGMQGDGVKKIKSSDYHSDARIKLFNELQTLGGVLIEEAIIAHPEMNFGGSAVNTIRMYTLLDENGTPHLLKAILRASTGKTDVDNFHDGGVIYEVDLETGVICSKGRNIKSLDEDIIIQPNTNIVMLGKKIPKWELVKEKSKEAAKLIPQCRYIGWDIAITADGVEFVEGNHDADHVLLNTPGSRCHWAEFVKYW